MVEGKWLMVDGGWKMVDGKCMLACRGGMVDRTQNLMKLTVPNSQSEVGNRQRAKEYYFIKYLTVILMIFFVSISITAQSIDSLVNEAIANNPKLKSLQYRIKASEYKSESVNNLPPPNLSVEFSQVPINEYDILKYFNDENRTELIIEDNGPGIVPELLEKNEHGIKKLFLENVTTKAGNQSSGYGCYIAYEISKLRCGWNIDAENSPNGGCKFTIEIPN
jgi:hypothetical protein